MSDLELRPGRFAAQRAGFSGFMRLFARPGAAFGGIVLLILIPCVFLAPWIAPYDPMITDAGPRLAPPSADHLFGTDLHGRDVFSRVVHGARYSLPVGVATLLLGLSIGGTLGLMLGYLGGRFDAIGARVVDVMLGFPSIVMAIMIVSVLGVGLVNVVIAVAIADIPRYARVIRGAVIVAKQNLFVESAYAMGASSARLMRLHILPTILPTVVLLGTLNLGQAILATATLSFLGLGTQPPTPEWGNMLNDARDYMRHAPWMMIAPGMVLFLAIIAFNMIGDRLNDILDPRTKARS